MAKKCQHCGRSVTDTKSFLCPSCGTFLSSEEKAQSELTHEQEVKISEMVIEHLANNRRFRLQIVKSLLLWILGALGLLGVFFSFSIWDSLQGLKTVTNKRLADVDLQTSNQIATTEEKIRISIAQEFDDPRIKGIISEVAASQASNLLVQQISPEIEKFRVGTSNTLVAFNDSLQSFQIQSANELANTRKANEFTLLISEAFGDNYAAFEKLTQIQNDPNSQFREIAEKTVISIIARYASEPATFQNMGYDLEKTMHSDPATNSLENLKLNFSNLQFSPARIFLLKYVYDETRFSKADRIDFVVKVMSSDPSISVRNYSCFLISQEPKVNISKTLNGIPDYIAWWNNNKSNYSNISTNHP
jgi:hypothetical protein